MAAADRIKTIDALLASLEPADEAGAMSSFDTRLVELPSFFWSAFFEKLLKAAGAADSGPAASLLENASARFAYHAVRGVLDSDRFREASGLSAGDDPEAVLHAAFALAAAWGWADAEIVTLQLPDTMVVRAGTYAEAEISATMPVSKPVAHAFRGICRAFMDLACGGPFPDGLGAYACRQTFGLELGDPYGEFIVTRAGA